MKQFEIGGSSKMDELNGMTHYVSLPTKGNHYLKDHPLYDKDMIEIKMLTTKEEDILTNPSYIEKELVLDKFLESIIVDKNLKQDMIYDSDQMAILIASRVEAYGKDYLISAHCAACDEEYECGIDLAKMLKNVSESNVEITGHGTSIIELPKSGRSVEFKILLPVELKSIEKSIERMKKLSINTSFVKEFYQRVIQSIDGNTDGEIIANFVRHMPIKDSRVLKKAYENSISKVNTDFQAACTHCGNEETGGLPIQASFFFPEF